MKFKIYNYLESEAYQLYDTGISYDAEEMDDYDSW